MLALENWLPPPYNRRVPESIDKSQAVMFYIVSCKSFRQKLERNCDLWNSRGKQDDLMYYYQSVVRPVLEYACPCWHLSLTKEQTKKLKDVQRRALQVILGNIQYDEVRRT